MNSRERIKCTLSHKQTDKLPVDFGSSWATGIHVSNVYRLRQYFGLDNPGTPVKVIDPCQMLGEIADDLKDIIGVDATLLDSGGTIFSFARENYKEWRLHDGTPVLVPGLFNTLENKNGSIYQYPQGDRSSAPSAIMPKKGFFFDAIVRQKEIKDKALDPKDNLEEFKLLSCDVLDNLTKKAQKLYTVTEYAITLSVGDSSFGDIALVPGISLKDPKGIRDTEEWYISTYSRKKYLKKIFEGQCEIAIDNLSKILNVIGDMVDVVTVSGTDFGMQKGLFASLDNYRELYKPYHRKVNDFIHNNSRCKTFIHSCGAVYELIPDLIDAGFDILNPVQIAAAGMNPKKLKKEFGRDITFWGGGVDTQETLPFGAPTQVKEEVKKLIDIFSPGGGFVFNTVHNIQADVPLENIIAMIEVIQEYRN